MKQTGSCFSHKIGKSHPWTRISMSTNLESRRTILFKIINTSTDKKLAPAKLRQQTHSVASQICHGIDLTTMTIQPLEAIPSECLPDIVFPPAIIPVAKQFSTNRNGLLQIVIGKKLWFVNSPTDLLDSQPTLYIN